MTDWSPTWPAPPSGPQRRPPRLVLVAGAAAAVAVLATVGAVGGWLLAGAQTPPDRGTVADASTSEPPATSTPTATPAGADPTDPSPAAWITSAPPAGQVALPDLVGKDFEQARQELRRLRLGWQLVFAEAGDDRRVERIEPRPGTTVRRGVTVKVYVIGAAPAASVPSVAGLPCARAAALVVEHGLYPDYPGGRTGRVVKQDPGPSADVRWNDRVRLYCDSVPSKSDRQ